MQGRILIKTSIERGFASKASFFLVLVYDWQGTGIQTSQLSPPHTVNQRKRLGEGGLIFSR